MQFPVSDCYDHLQLETPVELLKTILEWLQAILELLSGHLVFVFNMLTIFFGFIPWAVCFVVFLNLKIIPKKWRPAAGHLAAGLLAATADLYYRNSWNEGSTLSDTLNWVSPFRGGQFFFLPIWLLGLVVAFLSVLFFCGHAPGFVVELLSAPPEPPESGAPSESIPAKDS